MPPYSRLIAWCSASCQNPVNGRATSAFGAIPVHCTVKLMLSRPKYNCSERAALAPMQAMLPMYEG